MERRDYCNGLEAELVAWKAKLYDVTHKVDRLACATKEKILSNVGDLHNLITEMSDRVDEIRRECPTHWDGHWKQAIDQGHIDMRAKYDETMRYLGEAAPVSIPG
jgi:hypothetical protein